MADSPDQSHYRAPRAIAPRAAWGSLRIERVLSSVGFHREEITVMRSVEECRAVLTATVKPWQEFQVGGEGRWRGTFENDTFEFERFGLSGYMVVEGWIAPVADRCSVEIVVRVPPYLAATPVLMTAAIVALTLFAGEPRALTLMLVPAAWVAAYAVRFRRERDAALRAFARMLCGRAGETR